LIKTADLPRFVETLSEYGTVCAPVERRPGEYVFSEIEKPGDVAWNYTNTLMPPKKYFFPPREKLLVFHGDGRVEENLDSTKRVLLGVRSCDLHALQRLDIVAGGEYPDPYYKARRENTLVVCLVCVEPCGDHSFCVSMGTNVPPPIYDLKMTPGDGGFVVEPGTEKGREVFESLTTILEDAAPPPEPSFAQERKIDREKVAHLLRNGFNSEVWEKYAERCLSCGACNINCPTCYCYELEDHIANTMDGGSRERAWDGCHFVDFSAVAGGGNFRARRRQRLQQWVNHKLWYFMERNGQHLCVGCGRCVRDCPAGIAIDEIVRDLGGGSV